jgi:hypothetical protein
MNVLTFLFKMWFAALWNGWFPGVLPTAASVVSSGLAGYPTVYYNRVAEPTLQSNLFFYQGCDLRVMPDMSGVAMQLFNYAKMSANTTAVTEGTPGAGQTLTQQTKTINLATLLITSASLTRSY